MNSCPSLHGLVRCTLHNAVLTAFCLGNGRQQAQGIIQELLESQCCLQYVILQSLCGWRFWSAVMAVQPNYVGKHIAEQPFFILEWIAV